MTAADCTYFVTDIEADGLDPSKNSMLSFATVACSRERGIIDSFEAVLEPRADRTPDKDVMDWWRTQPEAYAEATKSPRPGADVVAEFADWVESHPAPRIFASNPLMLDGSWIDEYLRAFAGTRLAIGPLKLRRVFDGYGLDIASFIAGLFDWRADQMWALVDEAPAWWRGNVKHTHRAIDDATGYAHLLLKALAISAGRERHPRDFARHSA